MAHGERAEHGNGVDGDNDDSNSDRNSAEDVQATSPTDNEILLAPSIMLTGALSNLCGLAAVLQPAASHPRHGSSLGRDFTLNGGAT